MIFALSKLLWLLLRPSTLLVLAGGTGLLLVWRGRQRAGMALVTLGIAVPVLLLALPVDQWLLRPLEDRFPPVSDPPAQVAGIIVLGGATDLDIAEARGTSGLNGAAERMTEFVALARRYPQARLAFTGGSGALLRGALTEADVARRLFDALGLAGRDVIYESRSRNTYENAMFLRDLAMPAQGSLWVLVTSASHMPRSVGIFRRAGWTVLPWPVAYQTGHGWLFGAGTALGARLGGIDWACHEWAGLVAYRLLGRTDAVLPGP